MLWRRAHCWSATLRTASVLSAMAQRARLLPGTPDALREAGQLLRDGGLVAFPTETVYGLGANALNADAVRRIFAYKGRPATDPLIVHVDSVEHGVSLLELNAEGEALFRYFATKFWPGPLTLIGRAKPVIPPEVTSGTGFVGIRQPSHPLALQLLHEAACPVAAPSANRFGHVSPTTAQHVLADLGQHDMIVIDGGESADHTCAVGIESTVLKIDTDARQLVMYRRGGVSEAALRRAMAARGVDLELVVLSRVAKPTDAAQQAPGQLLTHYAPDVDTFLVTDRSDALAEGGRSSGSSGSGIDADARECRADMGHTVVVDVGGRLASLRERALAYRDVAPSGSMREAANKLFAALRWSEEVPAAHRVLLPDVSGVDDEDAAALADRMFRAASGKRVGLQQLLGL